MRYPALRSFFSFFFFVFIFFFFSVSDEEILSAQKLLARKEGIGVEPASAASIAGLKKLVEMGEIDKGETVTCVVTGHLLKDPNTAIDACTKPVEVDANLDDLKKLLLNK